MYYGRYLVLAFPSAMPTGEVPLVGARAFLVDASSPAGAALEAVARYGLSPEMTFVAPSAVAMVPDGPRVAIVREQP